MRLGVMSDTHGNILFMQRAADRMREEFKVQVIVHLGDDLADARKLTPGEEKLYAVPGVFEAAWSDGTTPHRLIEEFGGIRFLLSHTPSRDRHDGPDDIDPETARRRLGIHVLLHGHTHRFRAAECPDKLIAINPGHLKADRDRDRPATFAVIDAEFPKLTVEFYGLDGSLVDAFEFSLSRNEG